jgi:hypothetical protein
MRVRILSIPGFMGLGAFTGTLPFFWLILGVAVDDDVGVEKNGLFRPNYAGLRPRRSKTLSYQCL